jgi:hypothetical protein
MPPNGSVHAVAFTGSRAATTKLFSMIFPWDGSDESAKFSNYLQEFEQILPWLAHDPRTKAHHRESQLFFNMRVLVLS